MLGWVTTADLSQRPERPSSTPRTSGAFIVALIAAAAGVLSIEPSAKPARRIRRLHPVTTIPAAGNVALGLAFGVWHEVWGSSAELC